MKNLLKNTILCSALIIQSIAASAQHALLQQTIEKIESSRNLTYTSIDMFKNPAGDDTTVYHRNAEFLKMPGDSIYGLYFKINHKQLVGLFKGAIGIDTYNGQNILDINFNDSTYSLNEPDPGDFIFRTSLLGYLKWMKDLLNKNHTKLKQVADTTINSSACHHFVFNIYDSVIDRKRMYHDLHLFIDKSSKLPACIVFEGISKLSEETYWVDYDKSIYSDYGLNSDEINIEAETIPDGFHPPQKRSSFLLASGIIAPDWTLFSTNGKKLSLSDLKGKVVVLDFSFIGCGNCMSALKPMNLLHEKYKSKNVLIASIFFRDNSNVVKKFVNDFNIKYPVYVDANSAVTKLYNVQGAPCFYFIDKKGKIEKAIEGYRSGVFEIETNSILDNLLGD